jgi:hypothetical protein
MVGARATTTGRAATRLKEEEDDDNETEVVTIRQWGNLTLVNRGTMGSQQELAGQVGVIHVPVKGME